MEVGGGERRGREVWIEGLGSSLLGRWDSDLVQQGHRWTFGKIGW